MQKDTVIRFPDDNEILVNKNSDSKELSKTFESVTKLRSLTCNALVDFHFAIVDHTMEKEWQKIMK